MIINAGQPGRNDWQYTLNPLFINLTGRRYYNAQDSTYSIAIGTEAKKTDEKVYFMPYLTLLSTLGYDITFGGSMDDKQTVGNSSLVTTSYWYKWAIAHVSNTVQHISRGDEFIIFYNENGLIKRFVVSETDFYPFYSLYKSTSSGNWRSGSFTSIPGGLFLSGSNVSEVGSDYKDVMFECLDLVDSDAGYAAMVDYLLSDKEYPTGGGGGSDTEPDQDPFSGLIPPSYPSPRTPDTPGRQNIPIPLPQLPDTAYHAINTGFVSLYAPDQSSLRGLASKLWSTNFYDGIIKNFQDPMDAILSLGIVPFTVDGVDSIVKVGNWNSKNLHMNRVENQYRIIDLGSVFINEATGSYMDYSPYTRVTLYLPYIGFVRLNTDEVMGHNLGITYYVDLLTGACVVYITIDGYVHSQYTGNVMTMIPLSGRDASSLYQSAIQIGLSTVATMASPTGGLASALSAGALASSAGTVMNSKDKVQMGSSVEGSSGMIGLQYPYLVIESPRGCLPNRQNAIMGYPSFMTASLGSLSGYTEVDSIHLEGIPCTESELVEIEQLLKGGVVL